MDIGEFHSICDQNGGIDFLRVIIFDNSMRWIFDRRAYNPDGTVGRYLKPSEYMEVRDDTQTLVMKQWVAGVPASEKADPNCKKIFMDVVHVENIQRMTFCTEDTQDMRPYVDTQMM